MKKYIFGIIVIAVFIVITIAILSGDNKNIDEKVEVILGCEKSLVTAPVWIAEHEGYFEKNGINVNIREFDSGKESLTSLLEGKELDICTVAQTPIMFNSFNKSSFKILSSMVTSTKDLKIIARNDAGIRNTKSLKGKRVGLTKGSTGEYYFYLVLLEANLKSSDVEIVDIKPSELPNALKNREIDAICIWEPHALMAKKMLGENAKVLDLDELYREDFYFVAAQKFLNENLDTSKRFLQSISDAQKFIIEHEEMAKIIVSKRLGLDYGDVDTLWSEFNYQLILDQTVILTLEDEARWAIKSGLTDTNVVPNYLNFIETDILEKVEPINMQIFK